MSSSAVRTNILGFLASNLGSETVVDLTGEFEDLRERLADLSIQPDSPWLGVEFIGGDEAPVSLAADNDNGLYRETGAISFHICTAARLGAGQELVTRAEALRNALRGRRIGNTVIESVTPINTGRGATLEFEAGYVSGSVLAAYYHDITP